MLSIWCRVCNWYLRWLITIYHPIKLVRWIFFGYTSIKKKLWRSVHWPAPSTHVRPRVRLVRFEWWNLILNQTSLLSQAKTQFLSLINWKEDISMIYNRIMVEQRTVKTQEILKYSCGIRASTMHHVTSLSIVGNFTWAGCITQKYLGVRCITNCDFYIPIILPFTQSSRLLATIYADLSFNNTKTNCIAIVVVFFNRYNQGKVCAVFPRCYYSHICQWRGIHLFTEMKSWISWDTHLLSSFHWKKWTNDTNCHVHIVKY